MAGKKTHDLKVKVGEYLDAAGSKKGRWITVGRVVQYDDGSEAFWIDRTFNPAGVPILEGKGGEAVAIRKFEPRNNDLSGGAAPTQSQSAAGAVPTPKHPEKPMGFGELEDDIPF